MLPFLVQRNITEYGAFIDIGAQFDGLCHISNISADFVKNPADVLQVGQEVEARILKIETTGKFAVSLKPEGVENKAAKKRSQGEEGEEGASKPRQARAPRKDGEGDRKPRPPRARGPEVKPGDAFKGTVTRVTEYQLYAKTEGGMEGSLAREEVARDAMGLTPVLAALYKEGDALECSVLDVQRGKVRLTTLTAEQRSSQAASSKGGAALRAEGSTVSAGNIMASSLSKAGISDLKFPSKAS